MNYNTNYINYNNNYVSNDEGLSKGQKIIIISLMLVFLILLLIAVYLRKGSIFWGKGSLNTRTVMIFLDGNDLESAGAIATSELESLDPKKIDLTKTNILVYTGGTKEWHNFVKNDENAIYKLTDDGFEKVETYPKKNMGNPDTLTEFLNYGYNNYKTDSYNLIFFDHGGAVDGAIYDEFTNDNLTLADLSTALRNSPFNEKNKLQTVNFRTCLNGTLEVANVFSKYVEYMIASEEITYGRKGYNVLGFLNDVVPSDTGIEFGQKFIDSYKNQVDEIDLWGSLTITYAVTDLSKIDKLNESVNNFFKSINLSANYTKIAKIRSKIFQYAGSEEPAYDMVDLYDLIYNIKDINADAYNKFSEALSETVVYNYTNLDSSHGLSIYFPYNAGRFVPVYNNVVSLSDYGNFIRKFNDMKGSQKSFAFNISENDSEVEGNENVKLKLTQEQIDVFSSAIFTVVKKDEEHEGYYYYLYATNDVKLDSDGYLNAEINNKFIKAIDKEGKETYIRVTEDIRGGQAKRYSAARLVDDDKKYSSDMDTHYKSANVYFENSNDEPIISYAILNSRSKLANGIMIDLDEIEEIDLPVGPVKMVDADGKYTSNYETAPISYFHQSKMDELQLKWSSLDDAGNYYYAFTIYDINNNHYDSDLTKIGR